MKLLNKIVLAFTVVFIGISDKVFCASAYLEGEQSTPKPSSFLDNFDASLIMANWYKIVLIVVAVICTIGFIVSNVKKSDKQ